MHIKDISFLQREPIRASSSLVIHCVQYRWFFRCLEDRSKIQDSSLTFDPFPCLVLYSVFLLKSSHWYLKFSVEDSPRNRRWSSDRYKSVHSSKRPIWINRKVFILRSTKIVVIRFQNHQIYDCLLVDHTMQLMFVDVFVLRKLELEMFSYLFIDYVSLLYEATTPLNIFTYNRNFYNHWFSQETLKKSLNNKDSFNRSNKQTCKWLATFSQEHSSIRESALVQHLKHYRRNFLKHKFLNVSQNCLLKTLKG